MAARSFTSSSDAAVATVATTPTAPAPSEAKPGDSSSGPTPDLAINRRAWRRRLPLAFLAAVAFLIVLELFLRAMALEKMIRYEQGDLGKDAVLAHLHDEGATDVAFVGTSMTRDGIGAASVRRVLESRGMTNVSVGNFAVRGGSPDDDLLIVRKLLATPRPPKLIVIGVGPNDFLDRDPQWDWLAEYWTPAEWWRAYRRDGGRDAAIVRPYLGQSCINWLSLRYRTLRYRNRLAAIGEWPSALRVLPAAHPIVGEPYVPRSSLADNKLYWEKRLKRHLEEVVRDGEYPMGERLAGELAQAIRECRAAGVDVAVIEMPLSRFMRYHLPAGTLERFRAIARQAAADSGGGGATFYTVDDIGFAPRDERFFNAQHLNWLGRARFSEAVADAVVAPRLGGEKTKTKTPGTTVPGVDRDDAAD